MKKKDIIPVRSEKEKIQGMKDYLEKALIEEFNLHDLQRCVFWNL